MDLEKVYTEKDSRARQRPLAIIVRSARLNGRLVGKDITPPIPLVKGGEHAGINERRI